MNRKDKSLRLCLLFLLLPLFSAAQFDYPKTRKSADSEVFHGTTVADPYRWLECDTCAEVRSWVIEQNKVTQKWFAAVTYRNEIRKRLAKIWSFSSMTPPSKKADKFFIYKNDGTQNHSVLYWFSQKDSTHKILLDPNTFSIDGTTSLNSAVPDSKAKYMAYSISHKGSDWSEIKIKEIQSGVDLKDHLKWVKFSGISWYKNGFFYSRYDAPKGAEYSVRNEYHKVYYHTIGTDQSADVLIYAENDKPLRNFGVNLIPNSTWLVLSSTEGTSGNSVRVADAKNWKPGVKLEWKVVAEGFSDDYSPVGFVKGKMLFLTNASAPNRKLIAVNPNNLLPGSQVVVIPERESVLESVSIANGKLVVKYLENVSSKLQVFSLEGIYERDIELPLIGMVSGISGSMNEPVIYYSMVSYTFPSRIYKVDLRNYQTSLYFKPEIDFKSENFETKQVWYTSKDGTKVPMFITHKKGLKYDGNNPLFLFGYGGFNIGYTPEFRVDRSVFLENNGIYCVANIRGGGEFGQNWHKAGTKLQKQNVFNDFIAAAEYLIEKGYTNKNKIAIHGRSNGGLLAGACLTQRPDLFKCVIPQVGVLDMLKFHRFTIGWAWKGDYGSSDNKEEFEYLLRYSPVHNVKPAQYPATLVVTGDHDDRVVPAHSFKFIAELQANQKGDAPVLVRIDTGGGHGSGKPLAMQIDEYTDMWTFVFYNLGMDFNLQE